MPTYLVSFWLTLLVLVAILAIVLIGRWRAWSRERPRGADEIPRAPSSTPLTTSRSVPQPPPSASSPSAPPPRRKPPEPTIMSTLRPPRSQAASMAQTAAALQRPAFASVRSWGYQLQKLRPQIASNSPFDCLVVDSAAEGSQDQPMQPEILAALKIKPDGTRRLVLAYVSIGEAESYRFYWDESWKAAPPAWLLAENDDWPENFAVRYWDPAWQQIIYGSPTAFLDRVIAAGFDGVYLDKCDVFDDLREREPAVSAERPALEADMVAFIAGISGYLKARDPGLTVVMQNAETLVAFPQLLTAIDGIAKESLLFGDDGPERANAGASINATAENLDIAARAGKLVLAVEYLNDTEKAKAAAAYMAPKGYVLYVAPKDRKLAKLNDAVATV